MSEKSTIIADVSYNNYIDSLTTTNNRASIDTSNELVNEFVTKSTIIENTFPTEQEQVIAERYLIKRVLGKGAFGKVFLAEDLKIGRLVAIKQLMGFQNSEQRVYDRFIQEARIAGRLEHPNVVSIHNIEEFENETSIIMEYVGGGNLEEMIRKHGKLAPILASRLMIGILTGLDTAHHMEVIHRDVKPANILLGIGNTPKVTDFGVAHLPVNAGGAIEGDNEGRLIVGTPEYMAPELVKGKILTPASDIYSAGCIFFEMLTGYPPIIVGNNENFIEQLTTEPKPELQKQLNGVPEAICQIIDKMTNEDPEERYQDAMAVIRDLTLACSKFETSQTKDHLDVMMFANSPEAILYDTVYLLLLDEVITIEERAELNKRAERLGLSEIQVREIEERVRKDHNMTPLKSLESITKLISYFFKQNNGERLSNEQKEFLKQKQVQLEVKDVEIEIIKSDILF